VLFDSGEDDALMTMVGPSRLLFLRDVVEGSEEGGESRCCCLTGREALLLPLVLTML
jgi:hypothetical protein